jgi:hypothetical protein|tara:strand:- start:1471 stop:1758 length:288 start_codon:yes stop_codon:yes gene_type:complete
MFSVDRETAIIVALVACAVASYYIYTDLKKSKDDITKIKRFLDSVTSDPPPEMMYMQGAPPQATVQVQPRREAPSAQKVVDVIHETDKPVQKSPE